MPPTKGKTKARRESNAKDADAMQPPSAPLTSARLRKASIPAKKVKQESAGAAPAAKRSSKSRKDTDDDMEEAVLAGEAISLDQRVEPTESEGELYIQEKTEPIVGVEVHLDATVVVNEDDVSKAKLDSTQKKVVHRPKRNEHLTETSATNAKRQALASAAFTNEPECQLQEPPRKAAGKDRSQSNSQSLKAEQSSQDTEAGSGEDKSSVIRKRHTGSALSARPVTVQTPKPSKSKSTLGEKDDLLDEYTPLHERIKGMYDHGAVVSTPPISETTAPKALDTVVTSESDQLDESQAICLDVMLHVRYPEDVMLSRNAASGKLKCAWPVRRIRNMTGLNKQTQAELKREGFTDSNNSSNIKKDLHVFARIMGDDRSKWQILDLTRKKIVAFDDKAAREQITIELAQKDRADRAALKLAMDRAQKMIEDARNRLASSPEATETGDEKFDVSAAVAKQLANRVEPQAHQIGDIDQKPIAVNFRPGLSIVYSAPNMPKTSATIVEVSGDSEGFILTLADNFVLSDDVLVGAGDNKIMFPFRELKAISSFVVGKEGTSAAEKLRQGLDVVKGNAPAVINEITQRLLREQSSEESSDDELEFRSSDDEL